MKTRSLGKSLILAVIVLLSNIVVRGDESNTLITLNYSSSTTTESVKALYMSSESLKYPIVEIIKLDENNTKCAEFSLTDFYIATLIVEAKDLYRGKICIIEGSVMSLRGTVFQGGLKEEVRGDRYGKREG